MLNLHTHHPRPDAPADWLEIVNHSFGQPLPAATRWRSAGLHPWWLAGVDLDEAEHWLRTEAARPDVLAIGECGLDKVTATPWPLQEAAFERCIRVARDTGKPLILHCVRAFDELIQWKKKSGPDGPAWIVHGFDKHPDTAQMLLRAGFYLSFGAALFRPSSHAKAALQQAPLERLFLETDVSDTLNLFDVYTEAASLKALNVSELKKAVWANWVGVSGVERSF